MNFLAHAVLSGDDPSLRVGGVLGDFIKGSLPAGLPPHLAAGVELHRAIDSFSDRHPAFVASRGRISPFRRRVSGILVDLFYDHLLASNWAEFGSRALGAYTSRLYSSFDACQRHLPGQAWEFAELMRRHDWLASYRHVDEVGRVIDRMAIYRLRRPTTLAGGIEEFLADAPGFAADFRQFLPDAQAFALDWREQHGYP